MRKSSHHGVPGHSGPFVRGECYRCDHNRFSRTSRLVPHDRLFTKVSASGVDSRVVILLRELLVGRKEMVRVGGQQSEEIKVNSSMPKGRVLGTLRFLAYVNDIWRNIGPSV